MLPGDRAPRAAIVTLAAALFLGVLVVSIPDAVSANAATSTTEVVSQLSVVKEFQGARCDKCNIFPPDVQVAVGWNDVVEATNARVVMWTKDGSVLKNVTLADFFGITATVGPGDPRVTFDNTSQRWFASGFISNKSSVLLAVSSKSDPTQSWIVRSFNSSTICPDQPTLGVNNDTVEISVNAYSQCPGYGRNFVGLEYWIVNKTDLLSGMAAPHMWHYGPERGFFSFHPVRALTPSNMSYMVTVGYNDSKQLLVSAVQSAPPNPKSWDSGWPTLPIPPTRAPPNATQLGSPNLVNTVDSRIQDAVFNRGVIWLAFNEACTPQNDTQVRSCIRVISLQTHETSKNFNVTQSFTISGANTNYYFPSLAIDAKGDLVVVFGFSSIKEYPGLMYTEMKINGSVAGLPIPPIVLVQGTGPVTQCTMTHGVCRYGDYFEATPDPKDPGSTWLAGEYMTASGWSTLIVHLGPASTPGWVITVLTVAAVFLIVMAVAALIWYLWDRFN